MRCATLTGILCTLENLSEYSYNSPVKHVRFVGSAKSELSAFPKPVRARVGQELFLVQVGRVPDGSKPMPAIGPGAAEIRVRDISGAFRVVYVAKFADAVYVLHAFQKKSQKTSREDLALAKQRYQMASEIAQGDGNG